jgi:hypothetical protein
MVEAKRRGRDKAGPIVKGRMADVCASTAAYLLRDAVDRTLFLGPVCWQPSDGTSARRWYFNVAGCKRNGEIFVDQLCAETEADTVEMRAGVTMALAGLRPCVMLDFDDELEMARRAESLWPGEKITRIRKEIEAERKAWAEASLGRP